MTKRIKKDLANELAGTSHVHASFLRTLYQNYKTLLPSKLKTFNKFLEWLVEIGLIKIERAPYKVAYIPSSSKSIFKRITAFYENSYLSFLSAFYLHQLTLETPKTIYITYEQFPKRMSKSVLTQQNIDIAFSKPIRPTKNVAKIGGYRVYFLNRKYSGNLGVKKVEFENEVISVTNLERTLIDALVRPEYSGGINRVVNAFKSARNRIIATRTFLETYARLDYIYPYHQAIGFLLEKTNNPNKELIGKFFEMPKPFKFYLVHNIPKEKLEFNKKWNIYYPSFLHLN